MNERQFGNKIRHLLNQGAHAGVGSDEKVRTRLLAARQQAIASQRAERAGGLAWAGNVLGDIGGWSGLSLRVLLPSLMLLVALGGVYTWQQKQRAAEVEEVDAALLTDDLPIDAYLDRGFQNYLKKTSATTEQ